MHTELDQNKYPKAIKVSEAELAAVNISQPLSARAIDELIAAAYAASAGFVRAAAELIELPGQR